jgi:hypothetical protein
LSGKIPDDVMADVHRVARAIIELPTAKEMAARARCSIRLIHYHIQRIANYEKRLANIEKRKRA